MTPSHVVVVPSTLALLPSYAGIEDPVPELRAAAVAAVSWLVGLHPEGVQVLAAEPRADNIARGISESAGARVARALLSSDGREGDSEHEESAGLLVVANGSATRTEKAPGHLDERALAFDEHIGSALRAGDPSSLAVLDADLAVDLWCHDALVWQRLGALARAAPSGGAVVFDYEGDPFGVQYWVARWTCGS